MKTYSVKELADISGVTPRTLRHYDKIGLLVPGRHGSGDYRAYGTDEVDRLQEILIYRELGMELSGIKEFLDSPSESRESRLRIHMEKLLEKRAKMDILINNVKQTIKAEKGEIEMNDDKKFEGIKKEMIDKNESEFGDEIREKWGDDTIDESNRKMMKMSKDDFDDLKKMAAEINTRLENAVAEGLPADSEEAMEIAQLHRKWLDYTWASYDADAHLGLVEMYIADERFKKYYDGNVDGCTQFLKDAVINMILREEIAKDELTEDEE